MSWISRNPEVVYTDLEDGAVLLNLETKFYYSLNESGQAIWRLIDTVKDLDALVHQLEPAYQNIDAEMKKAISTFLGQLEQEQLVLQDQEPHQELGEQVPFSLSTEPGTPKPFMTPELIKHDEPLHEVVMNPFDPQLPLAE